MRRAAYLLLASALATGCDPARDPAGTSSSRDSSGVVIAENAGPPPEPGPWRLSPEPVLEIGTIEGDEAYVFGRIRGAVRLSDGRIAVADAGAPDLRIFDAEGRHVRTLGREGEGPGEFQGPSLLGALPGDTLVVVDGQLRRISLFHPDAGFIRSATPGDEVPGFLQAVGMFGSGAVVYGSTVNEGGVAEGFDRRPIEFRSLALDGRLSAELGTFPGYERVQALMSGDEGTAVMVGTAPFGKEAATAVGEHRFYCGVQDTWEINVLRPDGSLERLIRWNRPPRPVTDEDVAAFVEDQVADLPDNDLAIRYRRLYRDAPVPALHPAHGSLRVDRLGWLWVQEARVSDDEPNRWILVDPEGRVAGAVDLPSRFTIEDVGADYVLGRQVDDLGVYYVRMYALTRPPAG